MNIVETRKGYRVAIIIEICLIMASPYQNVEMGACILFIGSDACLLEFCRYLNARDKLSIMEAQKSVMTI